MSTLSNKLKFNHDSFISLKVISGYFLLLTIAILLVFVFPVEGFSKGKMIGIQLSLILLLPHFIYLGTKYYKYRESYFELTEEHIKYLSFVIEWNDLREIHVKYSRSSNSQVHYSIDYSISDTNGSLTINNINLNISQTNQFLADKSKIFGFRLTLEKDHEMP